MADKLNAIERLETLLNEKDAEIEALKERLAEAEKRPEPWMQHRAYRDALTKSYADAEEPAPSPELPVPRLEIRWRDSDEPGLIEAIYSLVYRHTLGDVIFVPLGCTKSDGPIERRIEENGIVDLPFRDGVHMLGDARQLNLRAFGIVGEHAYEFHRCSRCGRFESAAHSGARFGRGCALRPLVEEERS